MFEALFKSQSNILNSVLTISLLLKHNFVSLFLKKSKNKILLLLKNINYLLDSDIQDIIIHNDNLAQQIALNSKKVEQLEACLLRKQIGSHFIYNTLSSIYTKLIRQTPELAEQVILLSEIMSYATPKSTLDTEVSIEDEIENINHFLRLQSKGCNNNVTFTVKGDIDTTHVLPMVLLTFVENAFKHGNTLCKDFPISILIHISQESLYFSCKNKKYSVPPQRIKSSSIGLLNTQKRLRLKYNDNHSLKIYDLPDSYEIQLTLRKI